MLRISFYSVVCMLLLSTVARAQQPAEGVCIQAIGRPSADSITLRWAPLTPARWQDGNTKGYIIERFTLVRKGQVLPQPERRLLTQNALKPLPLDSWEPLVKRDRYSAIAAQALYGGTFQIDMGASSDVFQIVNKAKENEQRFQFALFSADMSVTAARASGLIYTDRTVKADEKYLYRISIAGQDSCRGSVYAGPKDIYKLPVIRNVKVTYDKGVAELQWEKDRLNFYTAYKLERSTDGKTYTPVSDEPVTNFSPTAEETQLIFVADSVTVAGGELWYRVSGLTPFGEAGPASDNAKAVFTATPEDPPYINNGYNENNTAVVLAWEVTERTVTSGLAGFHVERSGSPRGNYTRLTPQMLSAEVRNFRDASPSQVNYYRVSAVSTTGKSVYSPIYLVQLVDSIPPAIPQGLSAQVNEFGQVSLTWKKNTDEDIYGYRVYRSNFRSEEVAQLTQGPIPDAAYADRVDLATLNRKVYYQVMAIDRNQNHSGLSTLLEVSLPDKVKPMPPVFLPIQSSDKRVELRWDPSSSEDVVKYDVYRRGPADKQWMRITSIPAVKDSVHRYSDVNLLQRQYEYTVVAVDASGLESEPALAVIGQNIDNALKPAVTLKTPVVNREKKEIVIAWTYAEQGLRAYRIFRSTGEDDPFVLYKTIPATNAQFSDRALITGKSYRYRVMAVFENERKSEMSKVLTVTF